MEHYSEDANYSSIELPQLTYFVHYIAGLYYGAL